MKRVLAAVAVVAAVAFAQSSWAACNVIPDPKAQLGTGPNPSAAVKALATQIAAENTKVGYALPYKGALGRIDRAMLTPLRPGPIRVAADGVCVPDQRLPAFSLASTNDLLAALIVGGKHGGQRALVTGAVCADIKMPPGREGVRVECVKGSVALDADVPQGLKLNIPFDPATEPSAPVRVAVFRAATSDAATRALTQLSAPEFRCETACAEGANAMGLGVCIDSLFTPTGLLQSQIAYGSQDLVKCEVRTTAIPWNEFATHCHNGNGSSGFPSCSQAPTTLNVWEDSCHGIYVPFKWSGVLTDGVKTYERQVQGQTSISHRPTATPVLTDQRVWVPGPEFVGTLTGDDVTGQQAGFVSDPRRAQLDVFFPSSFEFGIQGVADKDESIVHVVPRLAVSIVCTDGSDEACMGVPTVPSIDETRCACRDRYAADCACETITPARLFQCTTTGMPCSRHNHCNPGDKCSGKPKCQPTGTVWKKAGGNPLGTKDCTDDKHCKNEVGTTQCGYLLFDMHEIRETPTATDIVLEAKLSGTGSRKRRGICFKKGGTAALKQCSNGAGPPGCNAATDGDCTEYMLEARGGRELP